MHQSSHRGDDGGTQTCGIRPNVAKPAVPTCANRDSVDGCA